MIHKKNHIQGLESWHKITFNQICKTDVIVLNVYFSKNKNKRLHTRDKNTYFNFGTSIKIDLYVFRFKKEKSRKGQQFEIEILLGKCI